VNWDRNVSSRSIGSQRFRVLLALRFGDYASLYRSFAMPQVCSAADDDHFRCPAPTSTAARGEPRPVVGLARSVSTTNELARWCITDTDTIPHQVGSASSELRPMATSDEEMFWKIFALLDFEYLGRARGAHCINSTYCSTKEVNLFRRFWIFLKAVCSEAAVRCDEWKKAHDDLARHPAWQSRLLVNPLLQPGFEYYGQINEIVNPGMAADQQHRIRPVIVGLQNFAPTATSNTRSVTCSA
jgi:hypothetical protein